jgi:hypothetical protein
MEPLKLDCRNIRVERQKINNQKVFNAIKKGNLNNLKKVSNQKELNRVLQDLEMTLEDLVKKCQDDDITNKILSGRISKNATRQGTKDEHLQIGVCSKTGKKLGIQIKNLSVTDYRPTKSGRIITEKEMKEEKIPKDECLKSFDAKISGKIEGFIFAKIVYGNGGHQDNVFEEADTICNWVVKHKKTSYYVILIDTDLENKIKILKEKYKDVKNILIFNNYQFQEYMIENYSGSSSITKEVSTDSSGGDE